MRSELERATSRALVLQKQAAEFAARLESDGGGGGGDDDDAAAARAASKSLRGLQEELCSRELQCVRTSAELSAAERRAAAAEEREARSAAARAADAAALGTQLDAALADAAARPTAAAHASLAAELESLRARLAADEEAAALGCRGAVPHVARMQTELAVARSQLADAWARLRDRGATEARLREQVSIATSVNMHL